MQHKSQLRQALYTPKQAASELGITDARVGQLAQSLGLGVRFSTRIILFTWADIEAMRNRRTARGRPRKSE
jgi:hypothetical protein